MESKRREDRKLSGISKMARTRSNRTEKYRMLFERIVVPCNPRTDRIPKGFSYRPRQFHPQL